MANNIDEIDRILNSYNQNRQDNERDYDSKCEEYKRNKENANEILETVKESVQDYQLLMESFNGGRRYNLEVLETKDYMTKFYNETSQNIDEVENKYQRDTRNYYQTEERLLSERNKLILKEEEKNNEW